MALDQQISRQSCIFSMVTNLCKHRQCSESFDRSKASGSSSQESQSQDRGGPKTNRQKWYKSQSYHPMHQMRARYEDARLAQHDSIAPCILTFILLVRR